MFTPSEFIECLGKISIAKSVKGHLYKDLKLIGNRIDGIRCDTKKHFKLSIEELYCAYEKGVSTTTEMRNYIKGWEKGNYTEVLGPENANTFSDEGGFKPFDMGLGLGVGGTGGGA